MDKLIGKNLKKFRKQRKISQEEMGHHLGVHQTAISRIEDGLQKLTAGQLLKASEVLKKRLFRFFL